MTAGGPPKAAAAPERAEPSRWQPIACLLGAVAIFGLQPLAMKVVLGFFSPTFAAFARFFAAASLFGAIAAWSRRNAGPASAVPRAALWLTLGGVSFGLANISWNASLTYTTVGASSVLQLINPVILALWGIWFLAEGCGPLRAAGLVLALSSMFAISWNGQDLSALTGTRYFRGNMLALASGLGNCLCAMGQKVTVRGRPAVLVVAPMFAISAATCGLAALPAAALVAPFSPAVFALMVVTGLVGLGLGNLLFAHSMRTIPASIGAAALTASSMVSLVSAAVLLREPTTLYLLLGAPLTCGGVALAVLSGPTRGRPGARG